MIDLVAYDSAGRLIRGTIDLSGGRLTDTLAAGGILVVRGVTIRDLRRTRVERRHELLVDTRRLRVVLATGPRGSLVQRVQVTAIPATIHADPYVVHGMLHAPAPRDPLSDACSRPWLPLTDAVLEHRPAGVLVRERYAALLVNRRHAHAIVPTDALTHDACWDAAADPASMVEPERYARPA